MAKGKKLFFCRKYFFQHNTSSCLCSLCLYWVCKVHLYQIASTNTLRSWFHYIHVLLSCQSNLSKTKGNNHKGTNPIFSSTATSQVTIFTQNMKRFLKLYIKIRSTNQYAFSRMIKEITLKKLKNLPSFFSNRKISSISTFMLNKNR